MESSCLLSKDLKHEFGVLTKALTRQSVRSPYGDAERTTNVHWEIPLGRHNEVRCIKEGCGYDVAISLVTGELPCGLVIFVENVCLRKRLSH